MEAITIGRNFYPGYQHPIVCRKSETTDEVFGKGCYRLIIVESGSAVARLNDMRSVILAPALFCLNEEDELAFENSGKLKTAAVYFYPRMINYRFDFQNTRTGSPDFSRTDFQDRFSLLPFVDRNIRYIGFIQIGMLYYKQLMQSFDFLKREIENQADDSWPCRSRSYFLEMLFLLQRFQPDGNETNPLFFPDKKHDMEKVLLYLNTHYHDKLTIARLAETFHTNRTTLMERFYEYTGITINKYLIELRVKLAAQMLRDTRVQIPEVLERTGFNDITHFGRTFKKQTGHTPAEYRDKYCWVGREI